MNYASFDYPETQSSSEFYCLGLLDPGLTSEKKSPL